MSRNFISLIFIIVMIFIYLDNKPQNTNISSKSSEIAKNIVKTITPETDNKADNKEIEGNFVERALSRVASNALKTPEGQTFLNNLVVKDYKKLNQEDPYNITDIDLVANLHNIEADNSKATHKIYCGDIVKVKYIIKDVHDKQLESATKLVTLGEGNLLPALEDAIANSYVGSKLKLITPLEYGYHSAAYKFNINSKNKPAIVKVEAEIISKANPNQETNKIYKSNKFFAHQKPLSCGQSLNFTYKLTELDGKEIMQQKNYAYKIGLRSDPIIFSRALFNEIKASHLQVIFAGRELKNFENKFNAKFKNKQLKDDKFYYLEIFDIKADDIKAVKLTN